MSNTTPHFPSWRARLAPLGRQSAPCMRRLRQATLTQIEEHLAPALPSGLLPKNLTGAHSRERIFTLQRTVWGWLWQVLQAHTSCREVVRQVQALFALRDAGTVDSGTSAYCQARRHLSPTLLESLFEASFHSVEQATVEPARPLLQDRPIRVVDGSGTRLADTPKNRAAYSAFAQG